MKNGVRVCIDVGGTHTKAVAIDNATNKIIGKASVMTTHDDPSGVAAGVIQAFKNCLSENDISGDQVVFIAHSTTQATNALLEGDVAHVGVVGISKGGLEGLLAKKQTKIDNIPLGTGRTIHVGHTFLTNKGFNETVIGQAIDALAQNGAKVLVASKAFGVDNQDEENLVQKVAEKRKIPVTMASEISKLYGLTRRTRTAVINASILPKMLDTADSTESSVRSAGIKVPLMIMRGDGGVMDISEMKKRPVLTMLSGPAASVMGALMYLKASNGIYFEVGGTSTNIGVIKNGRPAIDYAYVGDHSTFIPSIDVRVLGVAGGSMVRADKNGVVDVGPRSAHIAGLPYAVYTAESEIESPELEFFSPKPGDPADYVAIRLASGKRVTITNSCAANVLGLVKPEDYSYGNIASARKAMQPLADYLGTTVEDVATQILAKSFEKILPVIEALSAKYKIERSQISLVGVGGGAAALIPYSAEKLGMAYSIPENAEVISSIGVALAMVRDVVERVIPNPTKEDIIRLKQEAIQMAIANGAVPDSIEVQVEVDTQTSKMTAIALGSVEAQAVDPKYLCTESEAKEIAAKSMRLQQDKIRLLEKSSSFFIYSDRQNGELGQIRIIDKRGFVKIQRSSGLVSRCRADEATDLVRRHWDIYSLYLNQMRSTPDFYICIGGKLMECEGIMDLEQLLMLLDTEIALISPEEEILVVTAKNSEI